MFYEDVGEDVSEKYCRANTYERKGMCQPSSILSNNNDTKTSNLSHKESCKGRTKM